jgi:hypothetical protein
MSLNREKIKMQIELKKRKTKIIIIKIGFIFLVGNLLIFCDSVRDDLKKPESILNAIVLKGARMVVTELFSDPQNWEYVLCKIASGDKEWLRVAVGLNKGAEAGASEMLALAVGEALEKAPENVFNITLNSFLLSEICNGPDVDDERYNSYELAIKAIDQRIKMVLSVKDSKLKGTCQNCILYLKQSKEGIEKYFNED